MSKSLQLCEDHRREPAPCHRIECRYHLAELYQPRGTPIEHMRATCALVVADSGAHSQDQVAELLGISRTYVDVIEGAGIAGMQASPVFRVDAREAIAASAAPRETTRDKILRILRAGPATFADLVSRAGSYDHVKHTLAQLRKERRVTSKARNSWELVAV